MARENGRYRGLLVDYGGVLTTDLFASFRAFCELEGLKPETIGKRFREDRSCRDLLIALETGKMEEAEFEPLFAAALGVDGARLIDRLFAGSEPDLAMLAAVRAARAAGNSGIAALAASSMASVTTSGGRSGSGK